ncbi:MAG: hypothetical protein K5989_03655 [Lachnospiraceae bacterium]|nr:hypothetical protein [Lachnospiraceae bacterium]
MKVERWLNTIFVIFLLFALVGCGKEERRGNRAQKSNAKKETVLGSEHSSEADDKNKNVNKTGDDKVLVVYFSYEGDLEKVANWIADETGGDLLEIKPKEPYSDNFDETVERAKKEQDENLRPEIEVALTEDEFKSYDTVFFGFAVWWHDLPMVMCTFLEKYDFSGKKIIPFFSHQGSYDGKKAMETLYKLTVGGSVKSDMALSIHKDEIYKSEHEVRIWVDGIGYGKE